MFDRDNTANICETGAVELGKENWEYDKGCIQQNNDS